MMKNLILDIGNTNVKRALFEDNQLLEKEIIESKSFNIRDVKSEKENVNVIISSVKALNVDFERSILVFDSKTPLPIKNEYKSASIGSDRLAAAVGAYYEFPQQNVLIIDIGSAITIDFLTKNGIFKGGNIAPGVLLRLKALHQFTDCLPLVEPDGEISLCATNTETAIRSGVLKGIELEIKGYIEEYKKDFPDLKIIFTGGDSKYFVKTVKNCIFADENLVLKGLNRILNYYDKKN